MKVISHAHELQPGSQRVSAAIGVFDGVHLGHQQVIRRALADARRLEAMAVVVTFDRHPSLVVAPDRVPPMLYRNEQKLRALEELGVDTTLMIPFDLEFSRLSGEEFIQLLAREFHLKNLCVGSRFTFGRGRQGDVALLQRLGARLGFSVHGLAAVALDGEMVSSTRVRQAIGAGRFDDADQMLGRTWALSGKVMQGQQIGRKLGFPTANLDVSGLVLPPTGVYAAHARVKGATHRAVFNLGVRPTLGGHETKLQAEAHLLNFSDDLYGEDVEVTFVKKLRDEQKFPSLEALKAQIHQDIQSASELFE